MVIGFVSKLVTAISFKKVLIWTLAGSLLVVGYTAYEHRADIFDASSLGHSSAAIGNPVGSIFVVSDATKKDVATFVKAEKSVVGFSVVSADIRLNARNTLYFYADPTSPTPPTIAPLDSIPRLPLFTKSEENNRQMIKLINGEFACSPYSTSLIAAVAPNVNKDVIAICRASLPPYYGHFAGFVSVLLNTDPDVDEQVRLKQAIEAMATQIYFRDVIPTSHRPKL